MKVLEKISANVLTQKLVALEPDQFEVLLSEESEGYTDLELQLITTIMMLHAGMKDSHEAMTSHIATLEQIIEMNSTNVDAINADEADRRALPRHFEEKS